MENIQEPIKAPVAPWSIIGVGPVGSLQAVVLTTLFPGQKIHGFDRHHTHVRGHGLQINKDTIAEVNDFLKQAKAEALEKMKMLEPNDKQRLHLQKVVNNVDRTVKFLEDNFTNWFSGTFIRTHVISTMLQQFAIELSRDSDAPIEFHLNNGVSKEDLEALKVEEPLKAGDSETLAILKNSSFVFGVDGSHSQVRETLFDQGDEQLSRETLSYLVEIKLDMVTESNFILDQIARSGFSSLTRGRLHFWTQGKDGTATLHIFVKKAVYDELRSKTYNGKPMGDHANPYRRLADLPESLQGPLQRTINNVIGFEEFTPSSLKITTIPMQVYQATRMVQCRQKRTEIITGDAAVGLVLEEGVNNGLRCAARHGLAMFRGLTLNPGRVDEELAASEKWVKERADTRTAHIKSKIGWIDTLGSMKSVSKDEFEGVENVAQHYGLEKDQRLALHGTYLLKEEFEAFERAIPHFDFVHQRLAHNQYSTWLLHVDRLYLELKEEVKHLRGKNQEELDEQQLYRRLSLQILMNATTQYINVMNNAGATEAEKNTASQAYAKQLAEIKKRRLHDCYVLGQNILRAGEAMIAFEKLQIYSAFSNFVEAIKRLKETEPKPREDVVAALEELARGIGEQINPASGKSLKIVLERFTEITNKLAANTLTEDAFKEELSLLDIQLFGQPPLSNKIQILICTVICAIVGALVGFGLGLLLGGVGAIPGTLLGAVGGSAAAMALAAGTGATAGALLGLAGSFFSQRYEVSSYEAYREQVKRVMGIERKLKEVNSTISESLPKDVVLQPLPSIKGPE